MFLLLNLIISVVLPSVVIGKRTCPLFIGGRGFSGHGTTGTIVSPNWPNNYPPSTLCDWTITVPKKHIVELTIHEMDIDLDADGGCEYDWLAQMAYEHGALIMVGQPMCGTKAPGPISSDTNVMVMRFTSDGTYEKKGFRATWRAVKKDVVWIAKGHYMYGHFTYEKHPTRAAAATVCLENNAILPTPKNEVENNNLASLNVGRFYLGMNDKEWDSIWVWDGDQSELSWFNWAQWSDRKNAPNGRHKENCAMMVQNWQKDVTGHLPGWWEDFKCDVSADSLVCQKDLVWSNGYTTLDERAKSQAEAKVLCDQVYGILPEPQNTRELTLMKGQGTRFYLGLTDVTADLTGRWEIYQSDVTWVGWAPLIGTHGGQGKGCVQSVPGWKAVPCDYMTNDVVCQRDARNDHGRECSDASPCAAGQTCTGEPYSMCVCEADSYYDPATEVCKPRKSYESACTAPPQCIPALWCANRLCVCATPEAKYWDTETNECEPRKPQGSVCWEGECAMGLTCTDGECACQHPVTTYYHADTKKCVPKKTHGSACAAPVECAARGGHQLQCTEGKCLCQASHYYFASTKSCHTRIERGGICSFAPSGCVQGLSCIAHVCGGRVADSSKDTHTTRRQQRF